LRFLNLWLRGAGNSRTALFVVLESSPFYRFEVKKNIIILSKQTIAYFNNCGTNVLIESERRFVLKIKNTSDMGIK